MAVETYTQFRGLNLRDSPINKSPEYASDLQNVELSSRRELLKRYGYDEEFVDSSILDVVEYISGSKLIFLKSDGLYEESGGSLVKIPFAGDGSNWSGLIDYDEYNGVLYFSDTTGGNFLYKYDSNRVYRAGLPKVNVTAEVDGGFGSSTNYFWRIFFFKIDSQENVVFGDYYQTDQLSYTGEPEFTIDTLNSTEFPWDNNVNSTQDVKCLIAYSSNKTYGYRFVGDSSNDPKVFTVDHSAASDTIQVASGGASLYDDNNTPLDDIYDPTLIKGLPPKCKFIRIYGETMVLGNNQGTPGSLENDPESSFYWSDTGVGSTVETFPPFNRQDVGKNQEGNLSGLFASENELIVMKEKQVYYVNGILIGRNFRLKSSLSAGIGCVSHKSIIETPGGCFFQHTDGIYFAGAGRVPEEISDLIEPIFTEDTTGLDFTKTRAIRDTKNEKLLFFIPATSDSDDIVLVYDYYHKEWFKHTNIHADKGFSVLNDELYHCDGTSLFKRSTSYNDDGSAIEAFWKSAYNHLGFPAFKKLYRKINVHSIGDISWTCNLKTQKNYSAIDDTDLNIAFDSNTFLEDKPINKSNCYSLRVEFRNNTLNEGMLVSGYDLEYDQNQYIMKGQD